MTLESKLKTAAITGIAAIMGFTASIDKSMEAFETESAYAHDFPNPYAHKVDENNEKNNPKSITNTYHQKARVESEGVRIYRGRIESRAYTIKGDDLQKDYLAHRDEYLAALKKDKILEKNDTYEKLIAFLDNNIKKIKESNTYYAGYQSFNFNNEHYIIFEIDANTIKFMVE